MAATVLLKLAAYTGDSRYADAADKTIAPVTTYAHRYPTAFGQWLSAIAAHLAGTAEIAISGDPRSSDARHLVDMVRSAFRPFHVLAVGRSETSDVPLLQDRPMRDDKATAYVCRNFACRAPTSDPAELAAQLASGA
jgi:uncharacterized protein YyaL (SSP411 family)